MRVSGEAVMMCMYVLHECKGYVSNIGIEPDGECRPLNSHDPTVRLTISALLSRSHGDVLVSHGLLIN